ncbi:LysR substrate-binding domain-containing protein [Kyrpidia tusciae]|uniref:Transcriptional regulator, LysR family n=1 Tax=Kyrpidia tusciae (strain DSM 2912 / NBRC 15312 / T2) TaxID=562970 RepID=D5WV31_KYRT2|nr:LysR substrate-binding domain-containing protein [Kyrpidia tusciae]ADG07503.1 transcriptional regulator, LysR family [Kyrpidia tusciae DSM 2912]
MEYLNLRRLYVFQTVAKHLSFSRAADELYLSQPAVSQHIRLLEEYFDVELFEQSGKKIVLTEAGLYLKDAANQLFKQLEAIHQTVRDIRSHHIGSLKIAADTTAGAFVVPPFLHQFHDLYPRVNIKLDVGNRSMVLQRLVRREVDLAVMGYPRVPANLKADPFKDNPLVVIAPPDHPLTREANIPLDRLMEEPFLMRERGSGTRSTVEMFFDKHGLAPRITMELGSIAAIKEAVASGLGLSIVSEAAVRTELEVGKLTVLSVDHLPIMRKWYVVYADERSLSPFATIFRNLLLNS